MGFSCGVGGLSMLDAIFLSASVPDPKRAPEYARTADSVAITAAVTALVYVILGRRLLVWGGHPAISPMIEGMAGSIGVNYEKCVKLYQSLYFQDQFTSENQSFANVMHTEVIGGDRDESLAAMRERMLKENHFSAAVFVGGMSGIVDEYELFVNLHPNALVLPIASTGGASLYVFERMGSNPSDLADDFDYLALFHRHLGIPISDLRFSQKPLP